MSLFKNKVTDNFNAINKSKLAICETMQDEGIRIKIGNANKKVFCITAIDLQLLATLMSSGVMRWESEVGEVVKTKYCELMTSR